MAVRKTEVKKTSAAEAKENVDTAVKKAVKKNTARKAKVLKKEIYLQFADKELLVEEVTQRVQQIWTKELGYKVSEIESFKIYLKPEEATAYYVVNEISGKIEL